jgi:lipase maturation factor 1
VSGDQGPREWFTVRKFLRVMGLIYFIAFTSFGVQASGLIGSRGILPLADFLAAVRQALGNQGFWMVPSVLWLSPSNAALAAVWILGAAAGVVAAMGFRQKWALAACLVLWVSLCSVGQEFLSFQWDVLLSEAGFLALFADAKPVRVWLFRWLLFRVIFFSGAIKLLSRDPSWNGGLTAVADYYWTQPLPTPLAWLMAQLPMAAHQAAALFVLAMEVAVPFLFLSPWRRPRLVAATLTIALQAAILLTGNFAFFNLLTIALTFWLFVEPDQAPTTRSHRAVSATAVGLVAFLSGLLLLQLSGVPMPEPGAAVLQAASPFRVVNAYGLFAAIGPPRTEIVVEGSYDGTAWKAYEFQYKPGDVRRAPPVGVPHQPRLDWQMWFAARAPLERNRWFASFAVRLLQGEPAVLRLLAYNPFPNKPPRWIRAAVYEYRFTRYGEKNWWTRERKGLYLPPVTLRQESGAAQARAGEIEPAD